MDSDCDKSEEGSSHDPTWSHVPLLSGHTAIGVSGVTSEGTAEYKAAVQSAPRAWSNTGKAIPLQAWTGHQEAEAPRFQDSRHMKVVRLSALRAGRLYHPGNIPGTHFC
jgi:hypothetical protein